MAQSPQDDRKAHRAEGFGPLQDEVRRGQWLPLTVALGYALAGSLWIAVSDALLRQVSPSIATFHLLATWKGWLFVAVTASLLYLLVLVANRHIRAGQAMTEDNLRRLDMALLAARGGVWAVTFKDRKLFISPHLCSLLGLDDATSFPPGSWRGLVHPADLRRARALSRAILHYPEGDHQLDCRIRHRDGHWLQVQVTGRRIDDAQGRPERVLGVIIDRTALSRAEARIERLIHHDALTGLPGRKLLRTLLDKMLEDAGARGDRLLVARLNIEGFTGVNSEFGAEVGDAVLVELARILAAHAGSKGIAARLGGDEFACVRRLDATAAQGAEEAALALETLLAVPVMTRGHRLHLAVGIGVALSPSDGDSATALLDHAAMALSGARKEGGRQLRFYAAGMNTATRQRNRLIRDLREAVEGHRLEVHFQPVIRLADRSLAGFEALARWTHPEFGAIPPATFIPLAESTGLIAAVDSFVLNTACLQMARWKAQGHGPLVVAVNLSPIELSAPNLGRRIADMLGATGLAPDCLEIEVTESALASDIVTAAQNLDRLRALGVAVAIDDFGTGYSSLQVLRRLPVSRLKIDRSFVNGYGVDPEDTAIVDSILDLAARLGLSVTAEGVEEEAQFANLAARGCALGQGYLFGAPMPASEAAALVQGTGVPALK